jgi:Uma2 family endonuclease
MFERYTEKARRTIFFARYETSQFGGACIETEHLLLGLLREDKALANQFLGTHAKIEAIRHSIEQRTQKGPKTLTSVELPLSDECKRALAYGAEQWERMNEKYIGTPHLLLGILREEKSFAALLLREQGLSLKAVRDHVRRSELRASDATDRLREWLDERQARGGIWIVEHGSIGTGRPDFAIFAGDPPEENETDQDITSGEQIESEEPPPVPFLCIEMVRDQAFSELRKRSESYMAGGVAEVWLLDPDSKSAYTVSKAEGLREFKGEVLQIAHPRSQWTCGKSLTKAIGPAHGPSWPHCQAVTYPRGRCRPLRCS